MTYEIKSKLKDNILKIIVTGTWPSKNPESIIADILNHCYKHQEIPKLLDIRDMESTPTILGDYEEVGLFVKAGFRRLGRIAILDTRSRKESNDFLETTALNQGLNFRFFYEDEQEVSNWLFGKEDTPK
jgi:hypothetical protein